LTLVIAACSSGAATPSVGQPSAAAGESAAPSVGAAPSVAAGEPVTINYWENIIEDGGVQDAIIKSFEAAHPNVTIKRTTIQYADMQVKLPTAMGSGTGPDVVYYDVDPASLGRFIKAGQVLPLDDAYVNYGWADRVYPWAQRRTTYFDKRYAVGHELETLGLLYNQKIFDKLGLTPPTRFEDLDPLMQSIKDKADIIPMMLAAGPAEPWNAFHMMNAIAYATIPMDDIYAATPQGEGSYGQPWVDAFATLDRWIKAGFTPSDAGSIDWENHWALFCAGKVAMLTQGTWLFKSLSDCEKENPDGFHMEVAPFPVPDGKPFQAYVGLGSGWYVSSAVKSDPAKEQAALDFLDALISPEAAVQWVRDAQLFPAVPFDKSQVTLTPQQEQALAIVEKVGADGGGPMPLGFQNSPEEAKTWASVLQGIVAGSVTPQQAVELINVDLKKAQDEWKK
jgi:raffinose/stachyose/melibiose transport system substrate-binding protein